MPLKLDIRKDLLFGIGKLLIEFARSFIWTLCMPTLKSALYQRTASFAFMRPFQPFLKPQASTSSHILFEFLLASSSRSFLDFASYFNILASRNKYHMQQFLVQYQLLHFLIWIIIGSLLFLKLLCIKKAAKINLYPLFTDQKPRVSITFENP